MTKKEKIEKVLKEINSRIPKNLLKHSYSETEKNKEIKFVLKKGIEDKTIDKEKRKKWKNLLDSGKLDGKEIKENPGVTKKIDEFVSREINKAIKDGRLPNKKELKELSFVKEARKRYEKNKKNNNKGNSGKRS